MAATARQEREMQTKYNSNKDNTKLSPIDRLRAHILSKGVRSLKGIHQSVLIIMVHFIHKYINMSIIYVSS